MAEVPEPRLVIRSRREGEWCVIDVTDNGHGIATEHMGRVFRPFFTTKPVGKGTGLGLSLSRGLVRDHGGELTVVSEPGRGATFSIRLPGRHGGHPAPGDRGAGPTLSEAAPVPAG
jgi:signal transduction histidine kinase